MSEKKLRAILIDPEKHTIEEFVFNGTLDGMYAAIGCNTVCSVRVNREGDILWVDDNGMLTEGLAVWRWGSFGHPLAGRGLVVGCDEIGRDQDATIALDLVRADVLFTDLETTGQLGPTTQIGNIISMGEPILRVRKRR